MSRMNLLL